MTKCHGLVGKDEVSQIIGMLDDDEQLENEYLLKLAKSQMIDDDDEAITGDASDDICLTDVVEGFMM